VDDEGGRISYFFLALNLKVLLHGQLSYALFRFCVRENFNPLMGMTKLVAGSGSLPNP
jgi:hypothetical protein